MGDEAVKNACVAVTDFLRASKIAEEKVAMLEADVLTEEEEAIAGGKNFADCLEKAEMYAGCKPFMDHKEFINLLTLAWNQLQRSQSGRKIFLVKKLKEADATKDKDPTGWQNAQNKKDAAEAILAKYNVICSRLRVQAQQEKQKQEEGAEGGEEA
jgi:hypothetical protein